MPKNDDDLLIDTLPGMPRDIASKLKLSAVVLIERFKQDMSPAEASCVLWMALGMIAGMQMHLETADAAWKTLEQKAKDVFEIGFDGQRRGTGRG